MINDNDDDNHLRSLICWTAANTRHASDAGLMLGQRHTDDGQTSNSSMGSTLLI